MRERAGACWVSQCLQCTPRLPPELLWDTSLLPAYCVGTTCTCFTPSFAFQRGPSQPNDHHLNKLRSNFVFSPAHVYQHPPFGRPSSAMRLRLICGLVEFTNTQISQSTTFLGKPNMHTQTQICTRTRKYAHNTRTHAYRPPVDEGSAASGESGRSGLAIKDGLVINVGDYVKAYWRGGGRL